MHDAEPSDRAAIGRLVAIQILRVPAYRGKGDRAAVARTEAWCTFQRAVCARCRIC